MNIESIVEGLERISTSRVEVGDVIITVSVEDQNISINQFIVENKPYFDFVDAVHYIEYGENVLDLRCTKIYLVNRPVIEEPKDIGSTIWFESGDNKFVLLKIATEGFWTVFRYRGSKNIIPSFWNNNSWVTWDNISSQTLYNYEWGQEL